MTASISPSISYRDSLDFFFQVSNELQVFHRIFNQEILVQFPIYALNKDVNWLDIGSGRGEKTKTMLLALRTRNPNLKLKLSISEPDLLWHNSLKSDFMTLLPKTEDYFQLKSNTLEELASEFSNFDFITAHQLLYTEKLLNSFLAGIQKAKTLNQSKRYYYVSAENEDNILHIIRQEIKCRLGYPVPESQISNLKKRLITKGIAFRSINTTDKWILNPMKYKFSIDWFCTFLLGCSQAEYERLSNPMKMKFHEVIAEILSKYENDYLAINEDHVMICF